MDNTARIKKVNMEIARIRDLNMENRVELKILWTFSSDSHGNLLGSHKTLPTPAFAREQSLHYKNASWRVDIEFIVIHHIHVILS